jgi:hypothetical protein
VCETSLGQCNNREVILKEEAEDVIVKEQAEDVILKERSD